MSDSKIKKEVKICVNCGSTNIETVYHHGPWGESDGQSIVCRKCGCNKIKYVEI